MDENNERDRENSAEDEIFGEDTPHELRDDSHTQPPIPSPQPSPTASTDTYIILGWIFAILGFFLCCFPLLPITGLVLGAIAYSKGDQRGLPIIIVAAIALVLVSGAGWIFSRGGYFTPYHHHIPPVFRSV